MNKNALNKHYKHQTLKKNSNTQVLDNLTQPNLTPWHLEFANIMANMWDIGSTSRINERICKSTAVVDSQYFHDTE